MKQRSIFSTFVLMATVMWATSLFSMAKADGKPEPVRIVRQAVTALEAARSFSVNLHTTEPASGKNPREVSGSLAYVHGESIKLELSGEGISRKFQWQGNDGEGRVMEFREQGKRSEGIPAHVKQTYSVLKALSSQKWSRLLDDPNVIAIDLGAVTLDHVRCQRIRIALGEGDIEVFVTDSEKPVVKRLVSGPMVLDFSEWTVVPQ